MWIVAGETAQLAATFAKAATELHSGVVLEQVCLFLLTKWSFFENGHGVKQPLARVKIAIGFAGL